jgi:hypothetical protein
MTMATNLIAAFQRVGAEFRSLRTLIGGSATSDVAALQTTASNLVDAINEVRAIGLSKAAIDDANLSGLAVWSSQKTSDEIQAAVAALVNGAPGVLDTLQELAAALGNDPDLQGNLLAAISQKADAANVYTKVESDLLISDAARLQGVRVIASTDASVYADSSVPPQADPSGAGGWYFRNDAPSTKINWYPYAGVGSQVLGDITSIYMVVTFASIASLPFIGIYTKKTGTGDAGSWYRSRIVYESFSSPPQVGTTYLVYWGVDPGVYPELPRLNITGTQAANSIGPRAPTEEILTYSWGTNSGAAVGNVQMTAREMGHRIAGIATACPLVHVGASAAQFQAVNTEVTGAANTDYEAVFVTALSA